MITYLQCSCQNIAKVILERIPAAKSVVVCPVCGHKLELDGNVHAASWEWSSSADVYRAGLTMAEIDECMKFFVEADLSGGWGDFQMFVNMMAGEAKIRALQSVLVRLNKHIDTCLQPIRTTSIAATGHTS
jgi:hypothetical protein